MSILQKRIVRLVSRKPRSYFELVYKMREYSISEVNSALKSLSDNLVIAGMRWTDDRGEYNPVYIKY